MDKKVSTQLEKLMEGRRAVIYGAGSEKAIPLYEDEDETVYSSQVISPIVAEGDAIELL